MHVQMDLVGRRPLLRVDLPLAVGRDGQLVVNGQRLRFVGPLDLAGMLAIFHAHVDGADEVRFHLPEDPAVVSYLERMNVINLLPSSVRLDRAVPRQRHSDRTSVLVEVTRLGSHNADELATQLGQLARKHFSPQASNAVFIAVGELIDNAVSHGASPLGAFLCAQVYTGATTGRPGFEFAICDTGVGVLRHLRRNAAHADLTESREALRRALIPGNSGTTERRGYGLADLLDTATRAGVGRLMLRSGDGVASVVMRGGRGLSTFRAGAHPIDGTWAWLRVRFP